MTSHPLDDFRILSQLFYPRLAVPQKHPEGKWVDGKISVGQGVNLGYRFYIHKRDTPVILFFHGNGEIAPDYVSASRHYHELAGASLLVVDYRGYGWSSGRPLASAMLPDAKMVFDQLADVFDNAGIDADVPIFVKGRSLGSAPAIYLGLTCRDAIVGLIIESGYADAPSLFRRLGIAIPEDIQQDDTLPIGNAEKIRRVELPLLVIHGEEDQLIPLWHGKELYTNSPIKDKELVVISGAGHNNLMAIGFETYFRALGAFIHNHIT